MFPTFYKWKSSGLKTEHILKSFLFYPQSKLHLHFVSIITYFFPGKKIRFALKDYKLTLQTMLAIIQFGDIDFFSILKF